MRDIEVIDAELRLLAAIRHTIPEEEGRTPSTARLGSGAGRCRRYKTRRLTPAVAG
jgi:hypothetical protein